MRSLILQECPSRYLHIIQDESSSEHDLKHYMHLESKVNNGVRNFLAYGPYYKMLRMGYNYRIKVSLNFGKGRRVPLQPKVPGGRGIDYYHITRGELGYATTLEQSQEEFPPTICHNHSSITSSWESNVSIDDIF